MTSLFGVLGLLPFENPFRQITFFLHQQILFYDGFYNVQSKEHVLLSDGFHPVGCY